MLAVGDRPGDRHAPFLFVSGPVRSRSDDSFLLCLDPENGLRERFRIRTAHPRGTTRVVPVMLGRSVHVAATGSDRGEAGLLRLYDVGTGRCVRKCSTMLSFSAFGLDSTCRYFFSGKATCDPLVVAGDMAGQLAVWNAATGRTHFIERGFSCINGIACTEGSHRAFVSGGSGSYRKCLKQYNLETGRCVGSYNKEDSGKYVRSSTDENYGVHCSEDHQLVFSVGSDRLITVWSFNGFRSPRFVIPTLNWGYSIRYNLEQFSVICGDGAGWIEIFDLRNTAQEVRKFRAHSRNSVYDLTKLDDERYVSVCADGSVATWDTTGKQYDFLRSKEAKYGVCLVDPDGEASLEKVRGRDESERISWIVSDVPLRCRVLLEGCGLSLLCVPAML